MQVVDRKERRLLKGQVGGEPVEAVQDRERVLFGRRSCDAAVRGSEQRFHERGRSREQLRAEIRSRGRERWLEQLTHDPVRKLALELAAARSEHAHPRRAGNRARLREQAGLPMPALPSMTTKRPPPLRAPSASASSAAT